MLSGCKHGKVDNSWSLLSFKWKWYKTIYTNIELYEIEIHKHLEKQMNLQSQAIYVHTKTISNNVYLV